MAFFQSQRNDHPPHAFVFPYPVQGHIQPFMRFSKLLASSYGFLISFFNSEENHTRLSAGASEDESHTPPLDIRMLFLPDVLPSALEMEDFTGTHIEVSHVRLSKTFLNTDPAALEALIRRQNPPVTCLIVDLWVLVIAPHLAQNLGLTMFILFPASAASLAMAIHSPEVGGDPKRMLRIEGAPSLEVKDVNPFLSMCGRASSDYMCKLFTQPFKEKLVKAGDMILINTCEELEGSTLHYMREKNKVCAIGPLLPQGGTLWAEDKTCLAWLDEQPVSSVLYVSFGSLAPLSATQLQELALGLEASKQRILWVTRPDLIYGKAPDLPPDFVERSKERMQIISWAPQLQVLSHPAVGGFLSHCGWNSTLESITGGVPILTWPFFGDQMMNAKFVVQTWRIGLPLSEDGRVTRALVEERVRDLMEREIGKDLRERAPRLKQAVTSSLCDGGSSLNNLQHLFA